MGVDGIKPKTAASVGPTVEAKKAEPVKLEPAYKPPEPAKLAQEGFDLLKKKLMSVSGRYAAHKPMVSERADLKQQISGQRSVVHANAGSAPGTVSKSSKIDAGHVHGADCGCGPTLKDGTLNTAASKGANPAARPTASDFLGEATKAAKPGTPKADLEKAAAAKAKAAIEKDFGMQVKDGDKPWTAEELSRAHESFATMPAADQQKLKGLDLIRNGKASAKSQAEMGNKGTIAGEYMPNTDTDGGKRVKPGAIQLYDAAFPTGTDARKASMHVIVHEAGHAVEGRARDDAALEFNKASDLSNASVEKLNPAAEANSAAWGPGKPLDPTTANGASTSFGSVSGKDKPGMAFVSAQNGVTAALGKLQSAKTPEELTKAQTALDAAKATRDTALKGMSGHKSESKADTWVAATDKQEQTARAYADANVAYLPLKAATDARMKDLKAVATVTVGADKKISTSSKELAAYSKARGKEASVSGYGASQGPEGYAEAYALYQRDPAAMKAEFPKQYKFFHDNHKNAAD
ncbi:MAG: Peptidoglycan-binding domain 1 protein [Myxococcaceae bacterium]|nr:Peptidoglycan-binding domain 1 protein [Myxococcaceae bacterium]